MTEYHFILGYDETNKEYLFEHYLEKLRSLDRDKISNQDTEDLEMIVYGKTHIIQEKCNVSIRNKDTFRHIARKAGLIAVVADRGQSDGEMETRARNSGYLRPPK